MAKKVAFASENTRKQRSHGGLYPQDAITQLHRCQASLAQQLDFVGYPAALGADGQGYGLFHGTRAGRVGAGVTDQAQGARGDGGQPIFDERLEPFLDDHLGQHRVTRLFQAEDQVFANALGLQERCLTEAFIELVAVHQNQP